MNETADPAGAFGNVRIFSELPLLDEFLETTMDISDRRDNIDDSFIFKDKIEMDWLREYRVLGPERDDDLLCHSSPPFGAGLPNGYFTVVLMSVPLKSIFIPLTRMPKRSCISFS